MDARAQGRARRIDMAIHIYSRATEGHYQFNWRPLEAMPKAGKFLVVNMCRRNGLVTIGTATLNEDMPAQIVADYLRDALCWDDFPDISVVTEPEDEPADPSGRKSAVA
jgi:hypothetical protein